MMGSLKPIATAMALAVAATSFTTSAEAKKRHHRHHGGEAAVAAIFGLAAGAMLGSALSQPRYRYYGPAPVYVAPPPPPVVYQPAPVYVAPPPVYYREPAPVYYEGPEPWTREWYVYCESRYVSFDDRSGYYLGRDGEYHFCR